MARALLLREARGAAGAGAQDGEREAEGDGGGSWWMVRVPKGVPLEALAEAEVALPEEQEQEQEQEGEEGRRSSSEVVYEDRRFVLEATRGGQEALEYQLFVQQTEEEAGDADAAAVRGPRLTGVCRMREILRTAANGQPTPEGEQQQQEEDGEAQRGEGVDGFQNLAPSTQYITPYAPVPQREGLQVRFRPSGSSQRWPSRRQEPESGPEETTAAYSTAKKRKRSEGGRADSARERSEPDTPQQPSSPGSKKKKRSSKKKKARKSVS